MSNALGKSLKDLKVSVTLPKLVKPFKSKSKDGPTSEEVMMWFNDKKYRNFKVLRFQSLYFAINTISDKHKDLKKFKTEKLDKALTGGDYRQEMVLSKFIALGL